MDGGRAVNEARGVGAGDAASAERLIGAPVARRRTRGVRPRRAVTRRDRENNPLTYTAAGVDAAAG